MKDSIYKIGFWSGLSAFIATVAFVIVQALQLFRVLAYPLDEILIYGFSICIVIPFLIEMLAFHYITPTEKKFRSHGALIFTVLFVAFVAANYVVQSATVIPVTLAEEADKIAHSLFWDFDTLGYVFMGLAALFTVPIFKKDGLQKWVRYTFLLHGVVTPLIAFFYFYPTFSESLLLIGLPWAITAPMSILTLALLFRSGIKMA